MSLKPAAVAGITGTISCSYSKAFLASAETDESKTCELADGIILNLDYSSTTTSVTQSSTIVSDLFTPLVHIQPAKMIKLITFITDEPLYCFTGHGTIKMNNESTLASWGNENFLFWKGPKAESLYVVHDDTTLLDVPLKCELEVKSVTVKLVPIFEHTGEAGNDDPITQSVSYTYGLLESGSLDHEKCFEVAAETSAKLSYSQAATSVASGSDSVDAAYLEFAFPSPLRRYNLVEKMSRTVSIDIKASESYFQYITHTTIHTNVGSDVVFGGTTIVTSQQKLTEQSFEVLNTAWSCCWTHWSCKPSNCKGDGA